MSNPERRSPQWPSAASAVVGVIGRPIAHSLSPRLHNAAFDALGLDWVSVAFAVDGGRAAEAMEAMRTLGITGLSVTMPHKHEAAAAMDELTPVATRLGVVNCVTLHDGRLVGDSTDGAGFLAALERGAHFDPAGRRCLVVGAGGAGRAVILALAEAGATEVIVVNRSAPAAADAAHLAGTVGRVGVAAEIAHADLIVQATSLGMAAGDQPDALAFDPGFLHDGQVVADLVYNPTVTPILAAATARGATTVGGLGMLVHQAALAIERWTQQTAPVEAMWAAVERPGS
jgi:shikimate dehydrogenase